MKCTGCLLRLGRPPTWMVNKVHLGVQPVLVSLDTPALVVTTRQDPQAGLNWFASDCQVLEAWVQQLLTRNQSFQAQVVYQENHQR